MLNQSSWAPSISQELLQYAICLSQKKDHHSAAFAAIRALESALPDVEDSQHAGLKEKIQTAHQTGVIGKAPYYILWELKDKRNLIAHAGQIDELDYFLEQLCRAFDLNYEEIFAKLEHEDYKYFRKKFAGDTPQKTVIEGEFTGFQEADFRNLYLMKERLSELAVGLEDFCNKLSPKLYFDEISESISACVWLSALKKKDGVRLKIQNPGLSIVATNQNIRIHLDFGGRCREARNKYYKKLSNGSMTSQLEQLDKSFEVFDVYWYFNVEKRTQIEDFLVSYKDHDWREYVLNPNCKQLDNKFKKFNTVSENIYLVGKIIEKKDAIGMGEGFKKEIEKTFISLLPILAPL